MSRVSSVGDVLLLRNFNYKIKIIVIGYITGKMCNSIAVTCGIIHNSDLIALKKCPKM